MKAKTHKSASLCLTFSGRGCINWWRERAVPIPY
jgi:hypothetical protein